MNIDEMPAGPNSVCAVIALSPHARFTNEPELVHSIDITHVLQQLKAIDKLSQAILANRDQVCEIAYTMAHLIQEVKASVSLPPHVLP